MYIKLQGKDSESKITNYQESSLKKPKETPDSILKSKEFQPQPQASSLFSKKSNILE